VQREQLLSATERVRATGDRIKQGKQTLLETEELGVSILQDLHKQRETIMHARENVRHTPTLWPLLVMRAMSITNEFAPLSNRFCFTLASR
jgi:hypothetical protein